MKRMIVGMSMKRKDLGAWIENHTFQVMVALAQLYLFPQGNRVHWRKEVWEKFSRMYTLKKSGKLPSAKFILDNSWGMNKQNVSRVLQYAADKESEEYLPQAHATTDDFYQIVEDYFMWLADQLSRVPALNLADVKLELDRLGLDEIIS